jgi:hypothetical protein
MRRQKKTDPFAEARIRFVDYKDDRLLSRFIGETGKLLPEPPDGRHRAPPAAGGQGHQEGALPGAAALHQGLAGLTP